MDKCEQEVRLVFKKGHKTDEQTSGRAVLDGTCLLFVSILLLLFKLAIKDRNPEIWLFMIIHELSNSWEGVITWYKLLIDCVTLRHILKDSMFQNVSLTWLSQQAVAAAEPSKILNMLHLLHRGDVSPPSLTYCWVLCLILSWQKHLTDKTDLTCGVSLSLSVRMYGLTVCHINNGREQLQPMDFTSVKQSCPAKEFLIYSFKLNCDICRSQIATYSSIQLLHQWCFLHANTMNEHVKPTETSKITTNHLPYNAYNVKRIIRFRSQIK